MKRVVIMALCALFSGNASFSQMVSEIIPLPLQITLNKTSNLIFTAGVKSVDRGSRDILVQKARGLKNVLQVKAAREHFAETSLTVITDDGKLYAFTLTYSGQPGQLNLKITAPPLKNPEARFEKPAEHELEEAAMTVSAQPAFLTGRSDEKGGVSLTLDGIYVKDQVMYYQFRVENSTAISYDVSQFRFAVRDRKQARRTAVQQLELPVLFALDKTERIPGGQSQQIVIALQKRTIPDKKALLIQLMEENGGRHLAIRLKNHHLIKARPLEIY